MVSNEWEEILPVLVCVSAELHHSKGRQSERGERRGREEKTRWTEDRRGRTEQCTGDMRGREKEKGEGERVRVFELNN